MKKCSKCSIELNENNAYKKGERLQTYCKECFNKFCMERWIERKKKAILYKGGKCIICGYNKYYGALQFHHKNPEEKEFEWNKLRLRDRKSVV